MLCAFSFLIFLNFAVLSISFFAMEWFYQRRVLKMTNKNNACNIPAVMWGVNWAILCVAFWVAFAQLIVAIVQRANIATHNARRGYPKRFFEEEVDSDEGDEGLLVNETRAVKMERVNDTTDGGKILI